MTIYGIPNCNTVKKALDWLKANKIDFEFHDFKELGITEIKFHEWADQVGWEALVNKRGTTWKKLDPLIQNKVVSANAAFEVVRENPSMIKRPVIESPSGLLLGFDEDNYKKAFNV